MGLRFEAELKQGDFIPERTSRAGDYHMQNNSRAEFEESGTKRQLSGNYPMQHSSRAEFEGSTAKRQLSGLDNLRSMHALQEMLHVVEEQDKRCLELAKELQERLRELEARRAGLAEVATAATAELRRLEAQEDDRIRGDAQQCTSVNGSSTSAGWSPLKAATTSPEPMNMQSTCPPPSLPRMKSLDSFANESSLLRTSSAPLLPKQPLALKAGRPVGLPNRGADCFWLATLQCLRHTPGFLAALSDSVPSGPHATGASNLAEALAGLLRAMEIAEIDRSSLPLDTPALCEFYLNAMSELPALAAGDKLVQWECSAQRQQDAHEFLNQLLDCLGSRPANGCHTPASPTKADSERLVALERELTEAAKTIRRSTNSGYKAMARQNAHNCLYEYSVIQWQASLTRMRSKAMGAIFEGQHLTSIDCTRCGRYAASEAEPCAVEEVKLGKPDKESSDWFSSIGNFFSGGDSSPSKVSLKELLKRNAERCDAQGYVCPSCKEVGTSLRTTRFLRLPSVLVVHLNRAQPDSGRCGVTIEFEAELDLSGMNLVADFGRPLDREMDPCNTRYCLFGAVFHRGKSARSGHYFAYVLWKGTWVCVDDNYVKQASKTSPMQLEQQEPSTGAKAILLFYKRLPRPDER